MRIALGQVWQESNTLNPIRTTIQDFEAFGVSRGDEMLRRMADTNELGGFIQSLQRWPEKPELVGLVRLPAWPAGTATADTFAWLAEELGGALRQALPVDAVLLALHGAMTADDHPDVEGELLAMVRSLIGPRIPLVATLDLHANITLMMVQAADALVLYHTAPHVDVFETGQRGANVLRRILCEGARPTTAFQKIPAVMPPERANTQSEASVSFQFRQRLQEIESQRGVLTAGLATVQPWLDIPESGSAVLITTDGNPELAKQYCAEMAGSIWERRRDYLPAMTPVSEAVSRAYARKTGLVVLSDAADATTSGAPGDSVWLLEELLRYRWRGPVLLTLVAPELVGRAEQLKVGAVVDADVGGKRDTRFGKTISIQAELERMFDARFVLNGHLGRNLAIDMGRAAVLRIDQIRIIVTSRSGPHFAPELFQAAGFDPFSAAVVVAKSPCGFRAVYQPHAVEIMSVQAPGCAPTDFWNYPYERIPRPLWPWDEFEWAPR